MISRGNLLIPVQCMYSIGIYMCCSDHIVLSPPRIGRKSSRLVRAAALKLSQELLDMVIRPPVALVTRTQEG